MPNILDPQARINDLNRQIQNKRNAIQKENASYEALCRFKSEVERAQGDFDAVNGRDSQILEPLQPFQSENSVIDKYVRGMRSSLNTFGGGLVGHVFSALLSLISVELRAIYLKTVQYEADIDWLKVLRREAEAELRLSGAGNE